MNIVDRLTKAIQNSPTAYQLVKVQKDRLTEAGFVELFENRHWEILPGGRYFTIRNGSALVAWSIPKEPKKFMMMASHSDSPCFQIKNNPDMKVEDAYLKLNVESYGGGIYSTWLDRPLSVAGRVFTGDENNCEEHLVDFDRDFCMIPSLAIHMNRDVNKGYEWNVQKDLLPLMSSDASLTFRQVLASELGDVSGDILGADLYVYNRDTCRIWGAESEFYSAPRLDDQACAHLSLMGLLDSTPVDAIALHAVFDNEEVGSSSRQGACSTFLKDVLERIANGLNLSREDYLRMLADSFIFSADNAHALHPNYPEKCDPTNHPVLGGGVVLKFSANKKYTTDGCSAAKARQIGDKAGIKFQEFHNRSDIPGGSTLGNLSANQVPVCTADIGIAQLAMHSAYETCGIADVEAFYKLACALYRA